MSRLKDLYHLMRRPMPGPPAVPEFGEKGYHSEAVGLHLRRPVIAGGIVLLMLVLGLFLWAAFASIYGAVVAAGTVKVEGNSKQIRRVEPGIVRQILVREGQLVVKGQPLIRFDNTEARATVSIFQAAADGARVQIARFTAESANSPTMAIPPEIQQRSTDPNVAKLIAAQQNLFLSRTILYHSQADEYRSQITQLQNQINGLQAQVVATDGQSGLINEELSGVRRLNAEGYSPKTRLLALERSAVALKGQRGQQLADIARARQAIGEIRIQQTQLEDRRETEAADGIRTAQAQLTELDQKLLAAHKQLEQVELRAPVAGHVFNLTQFTEGGAAGAGELLMDIVPNGSKLVINSRVRPNDIADVKTGMPVRVTLSAFNPRTTPTIMGKVTLVSADATDDPQLRETYYSVRIEIDPVEMAKVGPKVRLTPGMPVQVSIVTSQRTILDYLLGPLTESMHSALRER